VVPITISPADDVQDPAARAVLYLGANLLTYPASGRGGDKDEEVSVNGSVGGQQRRPAKSPTASRWRLGVERLEVDEDDGLLPLFKKNESVRCPGWLGLAKWAALMGCGPVASPLIYFCS
jgi:hypothetical protein